MKRTDRAIRLLACELIVLAVGASTSRAASEAVPTKSTYDSHDKRDPFVPLVRDGHIVAAPTASADFSSLSLAGIVWDPTGRSIALINDAEVRAGGQIGSYHVLEIQRDKVILDQNGKTVVLRLNFEEPGTRKQGSR